MDILRICVTVTCNTSTRPFNNLPDKLSVPAAMFTMSDLSEDLRWSWFEFFEMLICYYSGHIYFIIKLQEPQETFLHFKQLYVEGNPVNLILLMFSWVFRICSVFKTCFFSFFELDFGLYFLLLFIFLHQHMILLTYDFIFLESLSCMCILSAISPSNDSFELFFTLTVQDGARTLSTQLSLAIKSLYAVSGSLNFYYSQEKNTLKTSH